MTARREVTDDDIETIAAEWAASGQPTMVEFARRALESGDERARQRCVEAIEARWDRTRQHDGSAGWRAGIEAAVRKVKMRQAIMPDTQTPGYRQALRDVLVHLEAMLERGTETSVEDTMRGDHGE